MGENQRRQAMTQYLLKVGDVFELKQGHHVYAKIPARFVYVNMGLSTDVGESLVKVGCPRKPVAKTKDAINNICKYLVQDFSTRHGLSIDSDKIRNLILQLVQMPSDDDVFIFDGGEFVVVDAKRDGGSEREGITPAHHVYCKRLRDGQYDPDAETVSFYQSPDFRNSILDVKPTRTLKMTFV
jgi:hypothetical protein